MDERCVGCARPGSRNKRCGREQPWLYTPPIKFTTGTLNFIGYSNLVVKNTGTHKHTYTHTLSAGAQRSTRNTTENLREPGKNTHTHTHR